ncbi:MAG: hypothetical protein M0015_14680 [Betaproteobacteria bacterium]|nr:hypothetical protein [Betaproteobacteria bacterium]
MLEVSATGDWRRAHPGAAIGLLELSAVENARASPTLDERKRRVEAQLRERYKGFSRRGFVALPVMSAYEQYYRRFDKSYHVLLQVESLVLKGKNLPAVAPLVDANFAAEVETFVLTAGHDVGALRGPVSIDASREGDRMTQMNGASRSIRAGDMVMRDAGGVCCSILYGQDDRSPISTATTHVLYVAYAPNGVPADAVEGQLARIEGNVRVFSPRAIVEQHRLLRA